MAAAPRRPPVEYRLARCRSVSAPVRAPPVAAAGLLLAGCGGGGRSSVSIAALVKQARTYEGKRIETQGVVQRKHDPKGHVYLVLADSSGNVVRLKPPTRVRSYVNAAVSVKGRFEIPPGYGRVILVSSLTTTS